ncbi:MAG: nucleotidyltransferase family protein [Methanocellales archaeon]
MQNMQFKMQAVILAAGRGTRLRPLTDFVAKPLLPVEGKAAIVRVIENLRAAGIEEFIVITGYLGKQIKKFLSKCSVSRFAIRYVEQPELTGAANALLCARKLIKGDFLVTASDCLLPVEFLKSLIAFHFAEKCDATIALKRLDPERIMESSTVKLGSADRILQIIEKPAQHEILSELSAAPVYIFKPRVFEFLSQVEKSPRGEYEVQAAIQMMIEARLCVKGLIAEHWIHLSNLRDFLRLNFDYMNELL